tara:strand:- start:1 stop:291 length:291 start_codon:yes stop_codon:yes gene_type:complete
VQKKTINEIAEILNDIKENADLVLPRGKQMILQAKDGKNKRGLLVTLLEDGGYDVAYWYKEPKEYPIEVLVDGKSVKEDAKTITLKFHPELKDDKE